MIGRTLLVALISVNAAAQQSTFEFRSNFWVNLHHILYMQASDRNSGPEHKADFDAAVDFYRREMVQHDLLSDEMAAINQRLSELGDAESLKDSGIREDLVAVLDRAARVYRASIWQAHNRGNLAWIEATAPLVAKYGDAMKKELAAVYQTEWPSQPIRTDLSAYASWAGAYTNLDPIHITMSSIDPGYKGQAALEMLFHESSHALIQKVQEALSAEAASQNRLLQRRTLWHAVLFYTAGELTRRRVDGYTPYAIQHGLYDSGWPGLLPILEKDWKPYIDGKIDLATAVKRLVTDYGVPR